MQLELVDMTHKMMWMVRSSNKRHMGKEISLGRMIQSLVHMCRVIQLELRSKHSIGQ